MVTYPVVFWPNSLPQCPAFDGAGITYRSPLVTFQPTSGLDISRRRGTVQVGELPITYKMTWTQVQTFENWFLQDLKHGSLEFVTKHPMGGQQVTAKFNGEYSVTRLGAGFFAVRFQLRFVN